MVVHPKANRERMTQVRFEASHHPLITLLIRYAVWCIKRVIRPRGDDAGLLRGLQRASIVRRPNRRALLVRVGADDRHRAPDVSASAFVAGCGLREA